MICFTYELRELILELTYVTLTVSLPNIPPSLVSLRVRHVRQFASLLRQVYIVLLFLRMVVNPGNAPMTCQACQATAAVQVLRAHVMKTHLGAIQNSDIHLLVVCKVFYDYLVHCLAPLDNYDTSALLSLLNNKQVSVDVMRVYTPLFFATCRSWPSLSSASAVYSREFEDSFG